MAEESRREFAGRVAWVTGAASGIGGGAIVNMSSVNWRGTPSGFAARPA